MGFFKTVGQGFGIMWNDFNRKHNDALPRIFSGTGTGLMMIGSALIARDSCKAEVQQAINEAEKVLQETSKAVQGEQKTKAVQRKLKARVVHGWKLIRIYKKGVICDVVGAGLNGVGLGISENGKHKALAATAAIGAQFAAYRGAVRKDLGEEADLKYMTGGSINDVGGKKKAPDGEMVVMQDENGMDIQVDPNVFRFKFSKETCPSLWSDNYDLRISNLEWVESNLNRQFISTWEHDGAISLNDMRREFGGLTPHKMDVGVGGIFGRKYDRRNPKSKKLINLHYKDDEDFMSGRKDWCWIIFDVDPEPIIGRINRKFTEVER